jgi:hypothetical protein
MFAYLKRKIKSEWCKYSETCLGTVYGGCNGKSNCIFMKNIKTSDIGKNDE